MKLDEILHRYLKRGMGLTDDLFTTDVAKAAIIELVNNRATDFLCDKCRNQCLDNLENL